MPSPMESAESAIRLNSSDWSLNMNLYDPFRTLLTRMLVVAVAMAIPESGTGE